MQQAAQVAQEVALAAFGGSVCPVHDAFAQSDLQDKSRYFSIARTLGYNVRKVGGTWFEAEGKRGDDGDE